MEWSGCKWVNSIPSIESRDMLWDKSALDTPSPQSTSKLNEGDFISSDEWNLLRDVLPELVPINTIDDSFIFNLT